MDIKLLLCVIIVFLVAGPHKYIDAAKSSFEMSFINCTCRPIDPQKILAHLRCTMNKSVKRPAFSIELKFNQPVNKFFVEMRIVLPRRIGKDFTLFNLTDIDGCALLSNKNQIPFLQLGRDHLARYSNIPKQCPFEKNLMYYIRNFRNDMQMLPAFTFESDMHLWFGLHVNHHKVLEGFIQSRVHQRQAG